MMLIRIGIRITLPCVVLLFSACNQADDVAQVEPPAPLAVSIMTFNVQNLFDTIDDPGKDDKAYLPAEDKQSEQHIAECNKIEVASWRDECLYLDWNEYAVQLKLAVLADAIRQEGDGRGADIIAFQEVENAAMLNRLRNEYLADSGYLPAILIEGDDTRGIDVAFLSRLPLASPAELRRIGFSKFPDRAGDTRGVLEATFELPDGALLTGFAVHFPAPFHPTAMRVEAYRHLSALRDALPDENYVFAAGDFNTSSSENVREGMLERYVRPTWIVAHDFCTPDCKGTNYYATDDSWSFLDMILYSPRRGEKTTWAIRADSVHVANQSAAQVNVTGAPARFRLHEETGVSDHWPLALLIESTEKQ